MNIRQSTAADAAWLQTSFDTLMGWKKSPGYFAQCCQQQANNELVLLIAADAAAYAGHVKVVWKPDYACFRENNIPEIQDLNVLPAYRRQGVATKLVDAAENLIRPRSKIAGIGFGLYADYGAAQRMYVKRGYVPDGKGIVYQNEYVTPGSTVRVDDDLVLYLMKAL